MISKLVSLFQSDGHGLPHIHGMAFRAELLPKCHFQVHPVMDLLHIFVRHRGNHPAAALKIYCRINHRDIKLICNHILGMGKELCSFVRQPDRLMLIQGLALGTNSLGRPLNMPAFRTLCQQSFHEVFVLELVDVIGNLQ